MASKGAKAAPPLQKRVSSFGNSANAQQPVKKPTYVTETKGKQVKSKHKSSYAAADIGVQVPAKITSKSGYDREVEKKYDLMLAGDLTNLPHLPRSIVRIFLSSTFSDMRAERNMLARHVYPKLRKLCAQIDLDFQVVDLRWGLTAETENDHTGTKVCLQEIKNCQDVSLGPNFVGILGHRYGMHRPLVVEIAVEEFEILLAEAKCLKLADIPLVEQWYKKDDNAVPSVYVLQPIRAYYAHFGDMTPGNEGQRVEDLERWQDTSSRIQHVFQAAAKSAYQANKISKAAWRQHFMSVTDHEVMNGVVKVSNPDKHTVTFIRDLTGLAGNALADRLAEKYLDLVKEDGKLLEDKETKAMISDMKEKVRKKIGQDGIVSLSTQWKDGGIDPEKFPEHEEYITQFCNHFLQKVTDLISKGIDQSQAKIRQREWYTRYNEALHHLRFCNTKCESFCGRQEVLKAAQNYILDPSARKPFIIHAPSGAGKTSVMAMIMKRLKDWLPDGYYGIIRFLGTSPSSLHVNDVLLNMCGQIADCTNVLMERISYTTWKRLKAYAPRLMRRVSFKLKKPIVILLDSLDQLASSNDAYAMDWLPTNLPQNIKIIVSTLPKEHGILDKLKDILRDPNCFFDVPLLPEATGREIFHKYLELRKRTITDAQLGVVLKAFAGSPSPLYLKLLMDQAVKYTSFFTPDPASIPASIRLAINSLYDELEVKFGRRLIQNALGLLTIGLNGLTDIELEDALSCCDLVLDEVYKFHDPPVPGIVRIPPVLWARIRFELREYLVERLSHGKTTLFWYHRQFIETATERYTVGKDGAALHAVLFEMFSAEEGVKKSVTLSNRKNLLVKDADRQTTPQPVDASNTRKLEAMTYHLMHTKNLVSLDVAKDTVFTNFQFLSSKLSAFGEEEVIKDFNNFLSIHNDEELIVLKQFIESQNNNLTNPRNFAFNIIACLSLSSNLKHLQELKKQAEAFLIDSDKPQLIPCLPCLALRPADPSFVLNGFTRVLDHAGDSVLVEKQSGDEDVSSFAIVNVGISEVTDVLLEANITRVKLMADGQNCVYLSADAIKSKKLNSGKEMSKGVADVFSQSKVVPKTTQAMDIGVTRDGSDIALFVGAQIAVVSGDLDKPRLLSQKRFDDCVVSAVISCGVDIGLVVASGSISDNKSFVALWQSGAVEPQVVEFEGSLDHSLMSLTADEQYVVSALHSLNDTNSVVVIQMQPFMAMPSIVCGQVSQLRVSGSQQLFAVLNNNTNIQFIDAATSSKLETITHNVEVSDFDVAWEEDRCILADKDGQVTIYNRNGQTLLRYTGHSHGISYLKYIGESITILTSSGLLKMWDGAAISAMMASSTAGSLGDGQSVGDSDALSLQTNTINIILDDKDQQLFTFNTEGNVTVWAMDSLKKLRSFSIGVVAESVNLTAFSSCVAFDKQKQILKVFCLHSGQMVCDNILPQNVLSYTLTADRQSILIVSEQPQLTLHRVELQEKGGQVTKKLNIQLGFRHVTIDTTLSASQRYLTLKVKIPEQDYKAVEASWKKGTSLTRQPFPYRFAAIDLSASSGHGLQCFRPLTKIPHLGVSIDPYTGNTMLVATRRWLIFWDIPTGKCDQRLCKSTRKTMFYRPDWVKSAAGPNISSSLSADGKLLAVGSEDGYMFVYEYESGMPVGMKAPATKHQAPVSQVCFTSDSNLVVSVCHNGTLKMWTAKTATQVTMMQLGVKVRHVQLTKDGLYLLAVSDAERSRVAVFKVHRGKV